MKRITKPPKRFVWDLRFTTLAGERLVNATLRGFPAITVFAPAGAHILLHSRLQDEEDRINSGLFA